MACVMRSASLTQQVCFYSLRDSPALECILKHWLYRYRKLTISMHLHKVMSPRTAEC